MRLSGILLLALCCLFGSGCHRDETPELVLLTTGGPLRDAVDTAVGDFKKENPGVRVHVVSTPGKDYYVKSLTMLAGKAPVDLLWLGQGFGVFAGRRALHDLMPFIEREGGTEFDLDAFNPEAVDWYRREGALYGIPNGVDMLVIAYNKDLFDAAGVPYPTSDWTVDEMIAMARKLTRKSPDGRRTEVAGLGFLDLNHRYHGLSLLTEDERRFGLNTPQGLEWLQRNVDLIHKEHILQRGSEMESMDRLSSFLNQHVAIFELATWEINEVHHKAPFRWDIVAIPVGATGKRIGWASSSGFSIARNAHHPELAWKLLKHLTSEDLQRKMLTRTVPTRTALQGEYLAANTPPPEHIGEVLHMLDHLEPDSRITAYQEVAAEWKYWQDQALMQKIPPAAALNKAESHINRILDLHNQNPQP